ncbi:MULTISPECIES: hypothetical protein [Streptomyces]|uniref:Uncharacterized protein n=1 Tax=Streptomyces caniscabiei TaxID=2746961 RepID=A0ABU4MMB0_9ACTN|nr:MULTISPECIES: hypothetical protein [Streptomyces]MBE4733816.1 hypothetical protein [Streptomyces caniscabiei]MBE4754993.1 hypothetical protein [Streptomyces caniscabiei]MBE4768187.1 hypothetical protein [Streptomyces caniscabiei]MBE4782311.1 hypothetical protein [Streptomyces caniscabiei]MBE4793599.1 hypothetical protein [Streptomyces caniscabiei]
MVYTMSTTPDVVLERAEGPARTAAEVNEEIRALWFRSGGTLNREQRSEYERLVLEWAARSAE